MPVADLERQRRAFNAWGKNDLVTRVAVNNTPELSNAMLSLAKTFAGWRIATGITDTLARKDGQTWFTRHDIKADTSEMSELLHAGQGIGLWKKDKEKEYWRHTVFTMRWCAVALASAGTSPQTPETTTDS